MKKTILLLLFSATAFSQIISIKHTAYEIIFDTNLKEPLYAIYMLKPEMLNGSNVRTSFLPDNLVAKTNQGTSKDYKGSFYNKGHLAPNEDFKFDKICQKESMFYTNCVPQNPSLNKGVWKSLENYARNQAKINNVKIIVGCDYNGSQEKAGKLQVPVAFWKIIEINGIKQGYYFENINPKSKIFLTYKVNADSLYLLKQKIISAY